MKAHTLFEFMGHRLRIRIPMRLLEVWLNPEFYLESFRKSRDI